MYVEIQLAPAKDTIPKMFAHSLTVDLIHAESDFAKSSAEPTAITSGRPPRSRPNTPIYIFDEPQPRPRHMTSQPNLPTVCKPTSEFNDVLS